MITFTIHHLYGEAYQNAIKNVCKVLNKYFGQHYVMTFSEDWELIHKISSDFGIKFDINGEIIK